MQHVEVRVEIPVTHYRVLADVAERSHVNARTVIERLVRKNFDPKVKALETHRLLEAIIRLNARGWNDREIADELGVNRERVRDHRNKLGLPRNDPRGRAKSTESKGQIA